jgi:putative PEP-CTERM system TPR-repeat lipoprotein
VGAAEVAFATALSLGVDRSEVVLPLADAVTAQGKQPELLTQPRFAHEQLPPAVKQQLLLRKAKALSDTGDARAALQLLEQARAIAPQRPDTWLEEVPMRLRARQFAQAEQAAAQALALAPTSADAWYHQGALAHAQGRLAQAQQAYDKALALQPTHMESRIALTGLALDANDLAAARSGLADLAQQAPREPRGVYMKALLAERTGDAATASAALRQVTALLDPVPLSFYRYRPQFLLLGGLAHFGLGEREKAKPYLLMAQRNQVNHAVNKLLAQIYIGEKNHAEAIDALETYLRSVPNDAQALSLLAAAEMGAGRPARAAQRLRQALAQSDAPALRAQLGRSLVALGKPQDAVRELEQVYSKDPAQTSAGAALVILHLQANAAGKARSVAEQLVKREPRQASYLNLLGIAQAGAGDMAGARRSFESALALDPAFSDPAINLAKLEITSGALEPAAARLNQVLKAEEKNTDAMLQAASLASKKNDWAQASRWLQKAADLSPADDLRAALALVDFHLLGRRVVAAAEAVTALEAKAPGDPRTLMAAGRVRLAQGDQAAARTAFGRAATQLGTGTPAARLVEVALLQLAAGDSPGARQTVERALHEEPDHLVAQELQVDMLVRAQEFDKAEALARKLAAAHPKKALPQAVLGDVAAARRQWPAAAAAYRKALQMEPATHTAQRLFKTLAVQPQSTPEAMGFARQWIKEHPADLGMRRLEADAWARAKDYKAARAAYEEVLRRAPLDLEASNNLVNVLILLKDPAALALAEQALKAHPDAAALMGSTGWAAFQAGKNERALELLRSARLRDPSDRDTRYMLAQVLATLGKSAEAKAELDAALGGKLDFDHASEAQALRARLNP